MTDMPRVVKAMLVWCLLVLAGVIFIVFWGSDRNTKHAPIASRPLPKNTLLLSSDMTNPGFTGRYIVAPNGVKLGAALRPEDVADQPNLLEPQPKLLLSLPVPQTAVAGGLNAGSKVQLCGKAPLSFGPVITQALRCELDKPAADCAVIVELPSDAVSEVAAKGFKDEASIKELRLSATCN
jgi:hypothetical protein